MLILIFSLPSSHAAVSALEALHETSWLLDVRKKGKEKFKQNKEKNQKQENVEEETMIEDESVHESPQSKYGRYMDSSMDVANDRRKSGEMTLLSAQGSRYGGA